MLLNRQRVLLEFLRTAGRPVGKIELMKWAFLLRMDYTSHGGSAYYEFVPYNYGPYSFGLAREAGDLANSGILEETEKTWSLAESIPAQDLPSAVRSDIARIVNRYLSVNLNQLLDEVYEAHKPYTVNSARKQLQLRVTAVPAVYTVGYESRQLDGLLDLLVQRGIRRLVDVRRNPISRRFGFHKSTLLKHCRFLGMEYIHIPELGIASEERKDLAEQIEFQQLFDRYEKETIPAQDDEVRRIAAFITESATAIMCMELEACECHRSRLAKRLEELTGLSIIHLK